MAFNTGARPFRDSYERNQAFGVQQVGGISSGYQSTSYVGRPAGAGIITGAPVVTSGASGIPLVGTSTYGTGAYGTSSTVYGGRTSATLAPSTVIAGPPVVVGGARPSGVAVSQYQTGIIAGPPVVVGGQSSTLLTSGFAGRPTAGRVSTREIDTKVSTRVGEKRLVKREERNSIVKGYNYGDYRLVNEFHHEGGIVNVQELRGEARVIQKDTVDLTTMHSHMDTYEEEAVIVERIVEKPVEVIIERKRPVERIVHVPVNVYVERPIEKIITREIITEKIMERPREKIVEIPVEVIYEIPVEKIIERHIEYETIVDVPVERIVERRVEDIIENLRYNDRIQEVDIREIGRYYQHEHLPKEVRQTIVDKIIDRPVYVDNIIERVVEIPVDRIVERIVDKVIEVPVERIIEKPVYVDNIIHKTVEIPVQRIVERPVEQVVERPVYVDNIIERPIPVERVVTRTVDVPVERIVDVPIYVDNIIHKTVEIVREVERPYENVIEIPVEQRVETPIPVLEFSERPLEKIYERPVKVGGIQTVPVEFIIEKDVFVPRENVVEVQVPQIIGKIVERDIAKAVTIERITERPVAVEKIVEVPVRRIIEVAKFVETEVVKEVPFEQTIERVIERIVERRVEVPVEKIIEVPVNINTERAITNERIQEEFTDFNATTIQAVPGTTQEQVVEIEDQTVEADIRRNQSEIQRIQTDNSRILQEVSVLRGQWSGFSVSGFGRVEEEYLGLKSRISELENRLSVVEQDRDRLYRKSQTFSSRTQVSVTVEDPQVEILRRELKGLIVENRSLVETIRRFRITNF